MTLKEAWLDWRKNESQGMTWEEWSKTEAFKVWSERNA